MYIRLFVILILISACNESDLLELPSQFSISTNVQGQTTAGLKGIDSDNNGIRDDIDQLIKQKFSDTQAIKRAAEQEARALQQFMEVDTKEEALIATEQIARATSCIFKILSDPIHDYEVRQALSTEIEAWTTNIKERLVKYLKSSKLISGAYFMQPIEPVCD
ncbi:MAG TPA: hypothetical protein ENK59_05890 [Thioploca sp.]|nr:hypothetical protein [Thioploca sp.]